MRTLVCTCPGQFDYQQSEMPQLQKDHAIINIKRIGICGTDLHAFEGTQPYFEYPRILGHELAGKLIAFDNATGFQKGEPVTFIPYFHCGACIACRSGLTNCCVNLKVCGVHMHGGFAEYLLVPSYSLINGDELSYDELALVEPLAIGAHSIRKAGIRKDEFVLIIGAGPIGLGIAEFARIAGGKVIMMDINGKRLQFCKEKMQVPHIINSQQPDVMEKIKELTNGDMPTVVIDATGNRAAINNSFQYMAHGARYILVGLQKGDICFSHPEFHKREATLMSSRNATKKDFEHVISTIKNGEIRPLNFITHRISFEQVKDEFENWLNPDTGIIKAMVEIN